MGGIGKQVLFAVRNTDDETYGVHGSHSTEGGMCGDMIGYVCGCPEKQNKGNSIA
jgi:hypothetical protein